MYTFNSRVRYSETDETGKLSVPGVMNYLQDCSTFQSEDIGLGIEYMKQQNRAWWLASWQIIIDRYPKLGEEIVIGTWPYDFKGIFGYRNFVIKSKSGESLVRANSVWFFFDTAKGCPARASADDIRGYGSKDDQKLDMDYAPGRITLPKEFTAGKPIMIGKHHIDTNHHVNNAQYVEIAKEVLPPDIIAGELRIEYKKAAVLGDTVYPQISRTEEGYTVLLCDEEGARYAVIWLRDKGQRG